MGLVVSGTSASLRWGYQPAATTKTWTATKDEFGSWQLVATLDTWDTFRLSQRPLVFNAIHKFGAWVWPVLELQITDGSLTARLGPKE